MPSFLPDHIALLKTIAIKRLLSRSTAKRYKKHLLFLQQEGLVDYVSEGHSYEATNLKKERATVVGPGWICLPAGLVFARIR